MIDTQARFLGLYFLITFHPSLTKVSLQYRITRLFNPSRGLLPKNLFSYRDRHIHRDSSSSCLSASEGG